jgi:hypothetical protein
VLLPFWRIRARVRGLALETHADLARLANLPASDARRVRGAGGAGDAGDASDGEGLAFWVPAFKVKPDALLRYARAATLARFPVEEAAPRKAAPQKAAPREAAPPDLALHPVTLAAAEAAELLTTLLASLARPKPAYFARLDQVVVEPSTFELALVPFGSDGRELSRAELSFAIPVKLLAFGENL